MEPPTPGREQPLGVLASWVPGFGKLGSCAVQPTSQGPHARHRRGSRAQPEKRRNRARMEPAPDMLLGLTPETTSQVCTLPPNSEVVSPSPPAGLPGVPLVRVATSSCGRTPGRAAGDQVAVAPHGGWRPALTCLARFKHRAAAPSIAHSNLDCERFRPDTASPRAPISLLEHARVKLVGARSATELLRRRQQVRG